MLTSLLIFSLTFTAFAFASSSSSSSSASSSSSEDAEDIDITIDDINTLRIQLRSAIDDSQVLNLTDFEGPFIDNRPLLATIVDLQWHDCAGPKQDSDSSSFGDPLWDKSICDGCIDFSRIDFHGTLSTRAVDPVEDLYQNNYDFSGNKLWKDKLSRADFWATVSTLSVEYAAEIQNTPRSPIPSGIPVATFDPPIAFYFGRKDCDLSPNGDETGFEFPPLIRGFNPSFNWFDINFEFTKEEFIALMGVHTLGKGRRDSSGFAHFWQFDDDLLDNDYYVTTFNPVAEWKQIEIDNSDIMTDDEQLYDIEIPNRFQWVLGNENFLLNPVAAPFFERALRLNVDISLFLKIEDDIDENTGQVNCLFKGIIDRGELECPFQDSEILDQFLIYANASNNQIWFDDFSDVWVKMVTIGYDLDEMKKIQP